MPAWSADREAVEAAAPLDEDEGIRIPRKKAREEIWPAQGLYVGASLITAQTLADFDGDDALLGPTDVVLIPDVDVGAGLGVSLSYRWYMNEIQVQYSAVEADGDFPGSPRTHDTTFYDLDVNWRHYFWPQSPIQPYGLLGLGLGRAEIEDGSTDQATGTVFQDAELTNGISVNVGVGAALYTLPWVAFYGQAMYRFGRYESSDGIDGELRSRVDSDGWALSVGAQLRVLPPRK
jgi:opacity protein-like surface antigen